MLCDMSGANGHSVLPAKHLHVEIPSAVELLSLVDQVSDGFARLAGFDEDSSHWLAVSVREAVINGIKHGNRNDPLKRVRLDYRVETGDGAGRVVVCIQDEGEGFDPRHIANPLAPENMTMSCGRGIFMMRSFMDDVQVRHVPGSGTEVTLTKGVGRA